MILKQKTDKCWHNLLIISEIAVFILDECENGSCRDIIFTQHLNDTVLFNFKIILHICCCIMF